MKKFMTIDFDEQGFMFKKNLCDNKVFVYDIANYDYDSLLPTDTFEYSGEVSNWNLFEHWCSQFVIITCNYLDGLVVPEELKEIAKKYHSFE